MRHVSSTWRYENMTKPTFTPMILSYFPLWLAIFYLGRNELSEMPTTTLLGTLTAGLWCGGSILMICGVPGCSRSNTSSHSIIIWLQTLSWFIQGQCGGTQCDRAVGKWHRMWVHFTYFHPVNLLLKILKFKIKKYFTHFHHSIML